MEVPTVTGREPEPNRRGFLGQSLAAALAAGVLGACTSDPKDRSGPRGPRAQGATLEFFPGFEPFRMETSGATINGVVGGSGPPLLLLHGWPQTHVEWHRITPLLTEHFTVVATDLRGYGDSSAPVSGADHVAYSKRAMGIDQIEVMRELGFDRFSVVGHDRGGRVAHRMTLDHPDAVSRLAVLDIVPTHELYSTVSKPFATAYYHWFFLIQPAPLPETLIGNNADFLLRQWAFRGLIPDVISEGAYADYLYFFSDPDRLHAMCEDYRAAATIDLEHDEADMDSPLTCPVLALWGEFGAMEPLYDVLATWRHRARDVRGRALPGGHWLPEQVPDELTAELLEFLTS